MKKEELRAGLKRLEEYAGRLEFKSIFLEEGPSAPMDTLVLGTEIGEEMSLDITCNFANAPEFGDILQFYSQLDLSVLLEENPKAFSEAAVLRMANQLNTSLPVGQLVYLTETGDGKPQNVVGLRYTMLTDLTGEAELTKCIDIIRMLMNTYEVLCSTLYLLLEGETLERAMETVADLIS